MRTVRVEVRFYRTPHLLNRVLAFHKYGHANVYLPDEGVWLNRSYYKYDEWNGWLASYPEEPSETFYMLVKLPNIGVADRLLYSPAKLLTYPWSNCTHLCSAVLTGDPRQLGSMPELYNYSVVKGTPVPKVRAERLGPR